MLSPTPISFGLSKPVFYPILAAVVLGKCMELAPIISGRNLSLERGIVLAKVTWDEISKYIDDAFDVKGRIERSDVLALAEANDASDDVIDALDAIGSRVFRTKEDTRKFLTDQGYVA